MDIESAKLLGAGIAVLGVIGSELELALFSQLLLLLLEETLRLENMSSL